MRIGNKFIFIFLLLQSSFLHAQEQVVSVAVDRLNVLYIGLANPLTIVVSGVTSDKVSVEISQGSIEGENGKYSAYVTTPGSAIITIFVTSNDGSVEEVDKKEFRVKRVPEPEAFIGGQSGGKILTSKFKLQRGIVAELVNFKINLRFEIHSFEMVYKSSKKNDLVRIQNSGPVFNEHILSVIQNAESGDLFFFENIKVKSFNDFIRSIGSIQFELE